MLIARSRVLFPVPEGPIMLITSPFSISQFTSFRTVKALPSELWKILLRCLMLIIGLFLEEEEVQKLTDYPRQDKVHDGDDEKRDKGVKSAAAD